jgi:cytoskeletal protein RodZ
MEKYIISFIEYCTQNGIESKILKTYHLELHQYSKFTNGEINKESLKLYMEYLRENSKVAVFKQKITILNEFYNFLIEKDIVTVNPLEQINKPLETQPIKTKVINDETPLDMTDVKVETKNTPPREHIKKKKFIIPIVSVLLITLGVAAYFLLFDGTRSIAETEEPETTTPLITAGVAEIKIASVVGLVTEKTTTPTASAELEAPPPSAVSTKEKTPQTTREGDTVPPQLTNNEGGHQQVTNRPPTQTTRATTRVTTKKTTTRTTTKITTYETTRTTTTTRPTTKTPTGVKATANSNGSITISWDVVSNAEGYEVTRATSATGNYSVVSAITIRDGGRVSLTDSNTNRNTTYFYRVRAFRTVNGQRIYSSNSSTVSANAR